MPKQLEASPSFKKWRKKSLLLLRGFKEAMKGFNVMRERVSYLKLVKQRLMAVCRISIQIGREFQNRKETFPISFYSFWNYTCFVHDFVCFLKTKKRHAHNVISCYILRSNPSCGTKFQINFIGDSVVDFFRNKEFPRNFMYFKTSSMSDERCSRDVQFNLVFICYENISANIGDFLWFCSRLL